MKIDTIRVNELLDGAGDYIHFVKTLLLDDDIEHCLNANSTKDYIIHKDLALTKFNMIKDFMYSLDEYMTELNTHLEKLEV